MNVKEIIERLQQLPENMDVWIKNESEFDHGLSDSIEIDKLYFRESPSGKALAKDNVVVITGV